MILRKRLREAIKNNELKEPFTTEDFKKWAKKYSIKNGKHNYSEASLNAHCSNSNEENEGSTNNNNKELESSENAEGKKEYWV